MTRLITTDTGYFATGGVKMLSMYSEFLLIVCKFCLQNYAGVSLGGIASQHTKRHC
jgi:hypothetical protein